MISWSACIENLSPRLRLDQFSGLYGLYCMQHRGHGISLITERKHNGQRHPSRNEARELGATRLRAPDGGHGMHHSIRDALRGASPVALLPGLPTGRSLSAKAAGGEVGMIGF